MKNFSLGMTVAIFLLVSCSVSTDKQNTVPQFKIVAESKTGRVSKFEDGNNTIYIYESNGAGGITVVKNCNQ